MKTKFALPYRALVKEADFSYASFMRWKQRIAEGKPPVGSPGPKKVTPFDLKDLTRKVKSLHHGRKRSRCTSVLHASYKNTISRRELNKMIAEVRRDRNRQCKAAKSRLIWHRPNLVWALDGFEYAVGFTGGKMHVQNLQDLCSRYKLPPLATRYLPCGEEVTGHLDRHFTRFGPPLFIKRDNGGNLNHLGINQLLEEAMVIPINSPVETASYNGAIEHSQGEIKGYLNTWGDKAGSNGEFCLLIEIAAHDLNHKSRRSLGGRTACNRYFGENRIRYSKRERKAAYGWIQSLAIDLSTAAGKDSIDPTAWRIAAKRWLVENELLTILEPGKVLPNFPSVLSHN
jgi:transposase InsO family protein